MYVQLIYWRGAEVASKSKHTRAKVALVKIGFLVWLHGMKELVLDDFEFGKKEKEVNYL